MITILASLVGFISSLIPEIMKFFLDKNDKKHELQILEQQIKIRKETNLSQLEEIIAMKIDIVQRIGRKKDFWDLHELLESYSIARMLTLHEERYPYTHDADIIIKNFTDFENADKDFEPICLKGKYWEIIKLDLVEALEAYKNEGF